MLLARRRTTVAAATLLGLLAVAGCSTDDGGGDSTSAASKGSSSASGCDGPAGPAFTGSATSYDAVARVEAGEAVGAQVAEPALTTKPSGADGLAVAELKVQTKVVTNGIFAVSPDSFVLVDHNNRQCARPKSSSVSTPFKVSEIDEKTSASGNVGFLVPEKADLSRYRVLYTSEASPRQAQAAWSISGRAPKASTATTCNTAKSSYRVAPGAQRKRFNETVEFGSAETVGVQVKTTGPRSVPLTGNDKQPNDVDGVSFDLRVTALGSVAYMNRDMFQLVDGKGMLCRYGSLGSTGETLSSDLVQVGSPKSFRIIFWVPKGSAVSGYQLMYRPDITNMTINGVWTAPTPSPSAKPKGSTTAPPQN